IDKISSDYRGDPAYALLEILDPNQNKKFIDNYLGEEIPYNLTEVMFICTANDAREIPLPLLDRMETIPLSSYTKDEKLYIAKGHLIPESLKKYNLNSEQIIFEDQAILDIIEYYTREAGVRELSRQIQLIVRKFIVQLICNKVEKVTITSKNLSDYLKKRKYEFTQKQKDPQVGVVVGLAYTGYGGDILPIEVVYYPRKEGELELTGNLGDIMKESAHIALSYIKANQKKFGIEHGIFSQNGIHVHVPEGAIPKEGPSAGIALTSAIISALTSKRVPQDVGMTGEITLHGHVEAIGGLKEKAIAAHRSGLKTIIIPKTNEKDIEDIPLEVRRELKIIMVREYEEFSEEKIIQAISEGILFGAHQSINYKEKEDEKDTPPNKLHAKEFAEEIESKFNKLKSVEVEILDKKQIEKNKMGLLLAVNAGSHYEPRVVILRYFGDKKNKKNILGLIGKGITFDSGGYNLKPSPALETMKFDMSGAAVVCASFLGLIHQKPAINVVAIACLTENTIGGHATLTESVITSMSGKTVEINNTDAEGRLVLTDGITYAIKKEKVTKVITVATLTGACVLALGEKTTGIMTNNQNTKALKENTTIADISNIAGNRHMGASSGAAFLQEFVTGLPFIHCDIAGTAVKAKLKRGTGVMVKTLIELFNNK
ncbi:10952_t:CDS:2, partial [Ambispora leptoticha]